MDRFKDQTALVTGASRGIGAAIARAFCDEGANVVLWDVLEEGASLAQTLSQVGGSASFNKIDITDAAQVAAGVAAIIQQYGKIDILINNAGIIRDRSFLKMSDQEWFDVINVNLHGTYVVTKAVAPHMKEAGYGRIISASSINGLTGAFGQTNYSSSKAAIIGFTKALAKELGKYGVTVNCIAPGFVKTDMTDSIPEEIVAHSIAQIPVKRIAQPEDLAHAYLFLADRKSGFINGETLNVNGGVY